MRSVNSTNSKHFLDVNGNGAEASYAGGLGHGEYCSSNRMKKQGDDKPAGYNVDYWIRSVRSNTNYAFCIIYTDGALGYNRAATGNGVYITPRIEESTLEMI